MVDKVCRDVLVDACLWQPVTTLNLLWSKYSVVNLDPEVVRDHVVVGSPAEVPRWAKLDIHDREKLGQKEDNADQ
jgi:hypothetical protein